MKRLFTFILVAMLAVSSAFAKNNALSAPIDTIDVEGNKISVTAEGRHDPCVLPRAVPVVEAMAAMVLLDSYLLSKTVRM